jgi:hypothetical protein
MAGREMTLDEYVDCLYPEHQAAKELATLRAQLAKVTGERDEEARNNHYLVANLEAERDQLRARVGELEEDLTWQKKRRNEDLHAFGKTIKERDAAIDRIAKQGLKLRAAEARAERLESSLNLHSEILGELINKHEGSTISEEFLQHVAHEVGTRLGCKMIDPLDATEEEWNRALLAPAPTPEAEPSPAGEEGKDAWCHRKGDCGNCSHQNSSGACDRVHWCHEFHTIGCPWFWCEACDNTGFYGDNGPGRKGNQEWIDCDACLPWPKNPPTRGADDER